MIWDSVATLLTPTARIEDPRFWNCDAGTSKSCDRRPNAVALSSMLTSVVAANWATSRVNSATFSEATFSCPARAPISVRSPHDEGMEANSSLNSSRRRAAVSPVSSMYDSVVRRTSAKSRSMDTDRPRVAAANPVIAAPATVNDEETSYSAYRRRGRELSPSSLAASPVIPRAS